MECLGEVWGTLRPDRSAVPECAVGGGPVADISASGWESLQGLQLTPVVPDIYCLRVQIANLCFVGDPARDESWVLVDAGLAHAGERIRRAAVDRFGDRPPKAVVLTHGHFDHVGALLELCRPWDVPVYAHPSEFPYLDGSTPYPPPNLAAGGGMMTLLSPLYPRGPIDLGHRLKALPEDGSIPGMPDWQWIHTPGHTPGHVSLYRAADGSLIAGDAFTTVKQESAMAVLTQEPEVHGPPAYFTMDWAAAAESVRKLVELRPSWAMTGHGIPLAGEVLRRGLADLVPKLERVAAKYARALQ
ncbi:MAG: MBL fold metallo-hydrolase [Alicyclobacillus sp.]|nr:MBL fold metallo-hydrolase [Alicyclobacillus sp.]